MERDRVTEPESTPQPAAREAVATAPHAALLSLQRSAGNRAVTRLLARTPQEDTLKAMQGTKGYGALTEAERKRLDTLIGGSTSLAVHAWDKMKALLDKVGTDKDAAKTFQDFVSGKSWLNFDTRLPGEKRLPAAPFSTAGPTDVKAHPYRSGVAAAKKTVVTITQHAARDPTVRGGRRAPALDPSARGVSRGADLREVLEDRRVGHSA